MKFRLNHDNLVSMEILEKPVVTWLQFQALS